MVSEKIDSNIKTVSHFALRMTKSYMEKSIWNIGGGKAYIRKERTAHRFIADIPNENL